MDIKFIGYFSYPDEEWGHAVFEIHSHPIFPDGIRLEAQTCRNFKIKLPEFPSYHQWARDRFKRRMCNDYLLKELWKPG